MKKLCYVLALLLWCAFLAGCGGADEDGTGITETDPPQEGVMEYQDILPETSEIFHMDGVLGTMVGLQFYQGERAMIWVVRRDGLTDICLYREDGSRETLLEGMPEDYSYGNWFLDADGGFYRWHPIDGLIKMDADGRELYRVPPADIGKDMFQIGDLCQLADGRVLITYSTGGGSASYTLAEVDTDTGKVSEVNTVRLDGSGRVAAGASGLLYLDNSGVIEINLENGSTERVLSFSGTSYRLLKDTQQDSIKCFRALEDGGVEFLRYKRDLESGDDAYISEVLRAETETTQKVVLTMRCLNLTDFSSGTDLWIKIQTERFNQQSDGYMVVLDELPEGTEMTDFARQTSIEMTTGKGPDLLYGDVLGDYAYGAIRKGTLVDLAPYMEASGIEEGDYFPAAFGCWKEGNGVYGVLLNLTVKSWRFQKGVLEGGAPDGEALADALLAWPEDTVLSIFFDSNDVLRYLLEGSEDFWGALDWDAGTCDFSGRCFAKILEASKRYGSDGRTEKPEILEPRPGTIIEFDSAAEREAEGMVAAGVLFDDGFHPVAVKPSRNGIMAVNANSAHVEGAWEFISFLLGEEAQLAMQGSSPSGNGIPVHREAFEECLKVKIARFSQLPYLETVPGYSYTDDAGNTVDKYPRSTREVPEEKVAEYREFLEDARFLPIRTEPLLDIVVEEAEYYFAGTKSIEEVSAIIQNRVQLYMDENM